MVDGPDTREEILAAAARLFAATATRAPRCRTSRRGGLLQGDAALPLRHQGSDPRRRWSRRRAMLPRLDERLAGLTGRSRPGGAHRGLRRPGPVPPGDRADLPRPAVPAARAVLRRHQADHRPARGVLAGGSDRPARAARRQGDARPASPRRAPTADEPDDDCAAPLLTLARRPSNPSTHPCPAPPTTEEKDNGNPALPARPGLVPAPRPGGGHLARACWPRSAARARRLQGPDLQRLHHARHRVAARDRRAEAGSSPRPAAPPAPSWWPRRTASAGHPGQPGGGRRAGQGGLDAARRARRGRPVPGRRGLAGRAVRADPGAVRRAGRRGHRRAAHRVRAQRRRRRGGRAPGGARRRGDERRAGGRRHRGHRRAHRRSSSWWSPSARWSPPA